MYPDVGYLRAKTLLKQRFGDEYTISEAWINKVTGGMRLKPTDGELLQNLADDLCNCSDTLTAMGCLNEVNNQKTLLKIISKLPPYLQHRWQREVGVIRRHKNTTPAFEHVVTFVKAAAEEINDPVYGKVLETGKPRVDNDRDRYQQRKVNVNSVAVAGTAQSQSARVNQVCPMCAQQHSLFSCQRFKACSVEDRLSLVRQNRLCFNCLLPGHSWKTCTVSRTCSVPGCNKKHTKFLHPVSSPVTGDHQNQGHRDTNNEQSQSTISGYVEINAGTDVHCSLIGAGSVQTALPIIPVCVRYPNTQAEVKTYALLDSGSTHSFCSSSLVQQLDLKGENVSLSLTTLGKSNSRMLTTVVSVEVRDTHGGNPVIIHMGVAKILRGWVCREMESISFTYLLFCLILVTA